MLLPFFNLVVFFIRLAGILNSIGTDSAWRTRNLTEEKQAFAKIIDEEIVRPMSLLRKIKKYINGE